MLDEVETMFPPRLRVPNCHYDLQAFHDQKVVLPRGQRNELLEKRNLVRAVIKRRLKAEGLPQPRFYSQGSFAMGTVVKSPNSDYDIDDGAYFEAAALRRPGGGAVSALDARNRILDAAYREHFIDLPTLNKNCVRVFYSKGFRIDIPVYRVSPGLFAPKRIELASSDWKPSDPRAVTIWFKTAAARSPGFGLHRQLTRIVRYLKAWSRSRAGWSTRGPSGFALTKLVVDCYQRRPDRDDLSLLLTLEAIFDRLNSSLLLEHPVLQGEYIYGPEKIAKMRNLHDRIAAALPDLSRLRETRDRSSALDIWDKFFYVDYFWRRARIAFI